MDLHLGLYPLHVFWVNSMRRCPRFLRPKLLTEFGIGRRRSYTSRSTFHGSPMKPFRGWRARLGWFMVGGDSPDWLIRRQDRLREAELALEMEAMEEMEQEYRDSMTPEQLIDYDEYQERGSEEDFHSPGGCDHDTDQGCMTYQEGA